MSQMRNAPYYPNLHHQMAVNTTGVPDMAYTPYSYTPNDLQDMPFRWRPSVYPQRPDIDRPTYGQPFRHKMATQQHAPGDSTWMSQVDGGDQRFQYPSTRHSKLHAYQQLSEHHTQPSSFFDEQMEYRPEQSALFNPLASHASYNDSLPRLNTGNTPFETSHAQPVMADAQLINKCDEGPSMLQIITHVDTAQYQHVRPEDWGTASIECGLDGDGDDAMSPTSTMATSHGPYTPVGSDADVGFPEPALHRISQDLSSSFGSSEGMFGSMHRGYEIPSGGFVPTVSNPLVLGSSSLSLQNGHHEGTNYAGLPFVKDNISGYPANDTLRNSQSLMDHVSFRDLDGLPSNIPFSQIKREQRVSLRPKGTVDSSQTAAKTDQDADTESSSRSDRDKYLLDMREKGFTYRDIKRQGRFHEAESTLRGRVRVLTKDKSERVRKPEWSENDVGCRPCCCLENTVCGADIRRRSNCSAAQSQSTRSVGTMGPMYAAVTVSCRGSASPSG